MSKNSSANIIEIKKKSYEKKLVKDIKVFLKSNNLVMKDIKINQKIKKQKLVEYRKIILQNEKKCLIIIIKSYFHLENLAFSWGWAR